MQSMMSENHRAKPQFLEYLILHGATLEKNNENLKEFDSRHELYNVRK